MNSKFYLLLNLIITLTSYTSGLLANEIFDKEIEALCLVNIEQLTYSSMGFEKAGEAYFSPDRKKIAFQAVPNGQKNYQIYVMDLKEKIPRMISTGKGACTCSFFRPDGKKIIFASSHDDPYLSDPNFNLSTPGYKRDSSQYSWDFTPYMNVYEANLDGSELKALTRGEAYHAECAYSADGSQIVFASNSDGSMNLYTMNSDGSNVFQVTKTTGHYNGGPFFSPDGTRIIFRVDRDIPNLMQIYSIHVDGSHLKQFTNNESVNWAPYWYPTGDIIAFTTSIHGHQHYEIYGLNINTGIQYRLTHNSSFDGMPVFSNDGQKMMWTSKRSADNTCQIFMADFIMPKQLKSF
jgi:TolB protein